MWLEIDHVVTLHRQMRQIGDDNNSFRQLLSRISMGTCTNDDFDLLNTKVIGNNKSIPDQDWLHAPIITRQNSVKDALNYKAVHTFSQRHSKPYHIYYSEDTRSGGKCINKDLQKYLHELHSGKTDHSLGMLPLVEGMPVMFTQNYDVAGGIVNGTMGVLKKVRYTIDSNNQRHAKSCIVEISSMTCPNLPHIGKNEVVALQESCTFQIRNPFTRKSFTITRKQLPICPAFAMTDYKSQGKSLDMAIIDIESCRSIHSLYVMLSRVRTFSKLLILRPFKKSCLHFNSKNEDFIIEMKRLRFHCMDTLLRSPDQNLHAIYMRERENLSDELQNVEFETRSSV